MTIIVVLLVLTLLSSVMPVLDRITDAPVMRRDVNDGTHWWRLGEHLRRREAPGWPAELTEDAPELSPSEAWRLRRRRPRVRPSRN